MYVHGYPANAGYPEVRKAVADSLNARFGTDYDREQHHHDRRRGGRPVRHVMHHAAEPRLTRSSASARTSSSTTTTSPRPAARLWSSYPRARAEGFVPDVEAIARAVTPRTKADHPEQPEQPDRRRLPGRAAAQVAQRHAASRRAREYGTVPSTPSRTSPTASWPTTAWRCPGCPTAWRTCIVGYSWSKSLCLPGERIGYLVIPGRDRRGAARLRRRRGRQPHARLRQRAEPDAARRGPLPEREHRDRQVRRQPQGCSTTACTSWASSAPTPAGAFYLWVKTAR